VKRPRFIGEREQVCITDDHNTRYFLKYDDKPWEEVDRIQWLAAERAAGFRPKSGNPDDLATGGFGSSPFGGGLSIQGIYTVRANHQAFRELYPDLPE